MPNEIQDKEIRGITGKVILSVAISMILSVTAFEVGYFKLISKIETYQLLYQSDKLIDALEKQASDKRIYTLEARVQELENREQQTRDDIEKYHIKKTK